MSDVFDPYTADWGGGDLEALWLEEFILPVPSSPPYHSSSTWDTAVWDFAYWDTEIGAGNYRLRVEAS